MILNQGTCNKITWGTFPKDSSNQHQWKGFDPPPKDSF